MNVSEIWLSQDFDGEDLLTTRNFLLGNNPESSWATKGYLFIKESPVYTLRQLDFQRLESDMLLIKQRLNDNDNVFCREILGKYLQIYLLDLWKFKASRCDKAYYFPDQGFGEALYDVINLPSDEWIAYMHSRKYIKDDDNSQVIIKMSDYITGKIVLRSDQSVICIIDDFSDLKD